MPTDYRSLSADLIALLGLRAAPVAIAFRAAAPEGVKRLPSPAPASCSYWRAAAEGQVFYTEADDHLGCPIGAHTHGAPMSEAKSQELMGMVEQMVALKYLKLEEVPQIPRRLQPLQVAVYAPLADSPCAPDLILVRGNARALMLLSEAAQLAGLNPATPTLGRPTCAVLPQALQSGRASSSFGCVGNRVYTGLPDDEGWCALPGSGLGALVAGLRTIASANDALHAFHRARA